MVVRFAPLTNVARRRRLIRSAVAGGGWSARNGPGRAERKNGRAPQKQPPPGPFDFVPSLISGVKVRRKQLPARPTLAIRLRETAGPSIRPTADFSPNPRHRSEFFSVSSSARTETIRENAGMTLGVSFGLLNFHFRRQLYTMLIKQKRKMACTRNHNLFHYIQGGKKNMVFIIEYS